MTSLEKICEQCVAVCGVPIKLSKDVIINQVERYLRHGRVLESDKVDGIESDKNLTRLVLLLESEKDVEHLCKEIKQEEVQTEEETFKVKFQKAIACELPERWEEVTPLKMQKPGNDFNQASGGLQQEGQAPSPTVRSQNEIPSEMDQYQIPPNAWPAGQIGPVSGFYHNIPPYLQGGGARLMQGAGSHVQNAGHMPQTTAMPEQGQSQGNDSSQGEENKAFERSPGFQHQGNRPGQGHQMPNYQYPYGYFPRPMPQMFRMPQNIRPDQKIMPSGQNMPFHPGMMGMPMFIDPHTGQPFTLPGFPPQMQQGPADRGNQPAGRPETQQPTGPPPPHNGAEVTVQGQGQGMQSKAVSDQDEMMQKLKAKMGRESQEDYEETQEHHYDTIPEEEGRKEAEEQPQQPEDKPAKIVVTNLPSTAHEDFLEMFFENTRKFGGGPVFNVEYDEESSSAVIEFEEPEAVGIVLDKRPIKMMGSVVEVEIYTPEEPLPRCTVEVTGPCSVICEDQLDFLEMYFESKRRSGGGDVVDCRFDVENNMVLVTFESEEVAQRVEERSSHVLLKERLEVKLHVPDKKSKKKDKEEYEEIEEPAPKPIKTVKVKGVNKASSKDTLEYYLENYKRSGGGEIEKIESDEEEQDVLYVTFAKAEDAENVSKRTTHTVEGKQLQVSLYEPPKPPPCYENKILIKGLKPSTTQDCLFNFIEAKSEFIPENLDYHAEQDDVVMVTFEKEIDFDVIKEVFWKHQLEGASLKVTPVAMSNCIIVANLPQDVTSDTVKYYFENERRSGGGPVDSVTMNDDDTCLVFFHDYSIIERVLGRKHKLSGQELDVRLYQDSLGKPEGGPHERKLHIPEPVVLKAVDTQIIKFMNLSQVNHDALNRQLADCYTSIQWPKNKGDVLLECTVTASTKDCFKIVKQWKENALKNFNDFMKNITVARVSVLQDIWSKVMDELKSVNISNPEAVAVFIDKNEGLITVVGYSKQSENISHKIEDITKKVMDEAEKEREKVKEVITNLKNIETRMLLADKFPGKMEEQFSDLKVKINQNKNEIVFEGPLGQVRDAKLKMYESKSNFANLTTDKLPELSVGLYVLKQTKDHIVKKLKANQVTAVWEVTDGCLVVCSASRENINQCMDIVRGCVIENTIALKKASKSVVNSENWQSKIDELHAYHAGKCHIKVSDDSSKVHMCATDDVAMELLDNIKKFLRLNTVTEIKKPCTKNVHRLIERHHKQELTNISKDLQHWHVQIVSLPGYGGFEVRGTEDGIQEARSRLEKLIQRVKQQEHTLQKPGLVEHMQTPKGKDNLHTIETTLPCVIALKGDNLEEIDENPYDVIPQDSDVSENIGVQGLLVTALCRVYDCRNVYTVKGDMTEVSAEMLVNPADDKLSLTGGLGKALVQKGGSMILKECADYIRTEGSLGDGDVFVSSAGKLKAEHIAHVMGPVWKGGLQEEEKMLEEAVFKCLQQASARSLNSIAIPAISCGTFGYPVKKATFTIVEAVKNFFREVQESTVTDIYLCDMKLNTVEGFNEALQRQFGRDFHKYQLSEKPYSAHGRSKQMSYDDDDDSEEDELKPMNSDDEYENIYSRPKRKSTGLGPPPLPKGRPPQRGDGSVKIGNISVVVVKGEIARQKVDVIVNTTAKNLDLKNGAVSASLLKAAGPELQQEVSGKYPNGIKDGEIAVTSGQKLGCDLILHSSMVNWDGGNADGCKKVLHTLMKDCLNAADSKKKASIAFPAIGTGNLGFPRDVVATEMFTAVSKFAESKQFSSIQDVRFIVYQKDFSTIQAFENEQKRWASGKRGAGGGGARQGRKYDPYEDLQKGKNIEKQLDQDHIYERLPGDKSDSDDDDEDDDGTYMFGTIAVSVKQGDIMTEDADCIVNSSNEQLDLSRGVVSQQLLKKCGKPLTKEIDKLRKGMKKDHIVVTSAPNLYCKHIIHVVAKETPEEWKNVIENCLYTAEKKRLESIAFPALGTGIQMAASDIAEAMARAIQDFQSSKPTFVKDVRLVIFQQKMVEDFHKTIKLACKGNGAKGQRQYGRGARQEKRKTQRDPNTVTFLIFSMTESIIQDAIKKLEACLEKEVHTKKFNDSIIKKMDDNQVMELKAIAQQHHIELEIESSKGFIQIGGIAQNVMTASDKIHRIMRDAATLEQQKNSAALMSNLVQWSFIEITETGQTLQPYEKELNYKIETAYISKAKNVKFRADDVDYVLDFEKMQEYPANDDSDIVTVLRRDLVSQGAFEQPKLWADMSGNLRVVVLQPTDKEYQDISQKFIASAGSSFNIVKVERVQNKTLWAQYQAKKKLLEDQNPPNTTNEMLLWHGTAVEAVDNINAHGFNRSYCGKNATAFGDGVYFAVRAQYSCSNTYSRPDSSGVKRMYYCRVLTGEYTKGKQGMRVPPKKGAADSTALYDSVVDNPNGPGMFIIFHDTQAYPEYLVSFKPQ